MLAAMKRSLGAGEWLRRGLGAAVLVGVGAIALGRLIDKRSPYIVLGAAYAASAAFIAVYSERLMEANSFTL